MDSALRPVADVTGAPRVSRNRTGRPTARPDSGAWATVGDGERWSRRRIRNSSPRIRAARTASSWCGVAYW